MLKPPSLMANTLTNRDLAKHFYKALEQMPQYTKFMTEICSRKKKN